MFDRFLKASGLLKYPIHFHTLRHTFATMLFEDGENPKTAQALMGHKDMITTLRNYNSVDQSQYRGAADRLGDRFKKKKVAEL